MEPFRPDWTLFPPLAEPEWMDLIRRELKGRPSEDLDWPVGPGLTGRPVYHDPGSNPPLPILGGRNSADWSILEVVATGSDPMTRNASALDALNGGAQAIAFPGSHPEEVPLLARDIHLTMAPVYWGPGSDVDPESLARALQQHFGDIGLRPDQVQGGFLRGMDIALHDRFSVDHPLWQSVGAAAGPAFDPTGTLTGMTLELRDLLERPGDMARRAGSLITELEIGPDYLVEIARIRAWRIVWGHLMSGFGLSPGTPCRIRAILKPDLELPWESTYIMATTRALSAVLGGVDELAILAPNHDRPAFASRIARNIHHLMKAEGHLDRIIDPLAGSGAVETLTLDIARKAWAEVGD